MERGFIFSLVFAVIVAIFALKNGDKVLIDFLFTKVEVSQAIVIFLSAILGAVTVSILGIVKNIKFRKEIKALNKKADLMVNKNKNLESLLEERGNEIKNLNKEDLNDNISTDEEDNNDDDMELE